MAAVYHMPQRFMKQPPIPAVPDRALLLDIADLLSERRFGMPALSLPVEWRELILLDLEELWIDLGNPDLERES